MPIKILKKTENPMASERFYQQRREALIDSGIPANMIDKFNATPNKLDASRILKKRKEKFKKAENPMADERFNAAFRSRMKKAGLKDSEIGDTRLKAGGLSGGQAKIAAKAPPPDKIDAKDFAVLKAEKAKGRGMGLQDEKLKPGKVQKAFLGKMIKGAGKSIGRLFGAKKSATATPGTVTMSKSGIGGEGGMLPQLLQKAIDDGIIKPASKGRMMKAFKGGGADMGLQDEKLKPGKVYKAKRGMSFSDKMKLQDAGIIDKKTGKTFVQRRMELAEPKDIAKKALKATRIGKIALGIGAAGVAASQYLKSKMKKDEPKKKMVGGMAKKYSVGGGADMGRVGEYKSKLATALDRGRKIKKEGARITQKDLDFLKKQRPMSYKNGGPMMEPAAISKVKAYKDYKASKNRDQAKVKKMVGGMAKKYSVGGGMMNKPMGYSSGSKLMDFIKSGSYTDKYGTKTNVDKAIKKINLSPKDKDLATMKPASDKKMMGGGMMQRPMGGPMGGMMQRPMGYKSGTMVKARGCKLGRTRPTKMY
jgi:hypothetical protein